MTLVLYGLLVVYRKHQKQTPHKETHQSEVWQVSWRADDDVFHNMPGECSAVLHAQADVCPVLRRQFVSYHAGE